MPSQLDAECKSQDLLPCSVFSGRRISLPKPQRLTATTLLALAALVMGAGGCGSERSAAVEAASPVAQQVVITQPIPQEIKGTVTSPPVRMATPPTPQSAPILKITEIRHQQFEPINDNHSGDLPVPTIVYKLSEAASIQVVVTAKSGGGQVMSNKTPVYSPGKEVP